MTRAQRTGELSEDIRALQENPDCTKEPLCKYIFSVDVYEDLIGIRSTADWAKGNADVPFMKEVKTNYAASNCCWTRKIKVLQLVTMLPKTLCKRAL